MQAAQAAVSSVLGDSVFDIRFERCDRTRAELDAIVDDLTSRRDGIPSEGGFAVGIGAETCAVELSATLSDDETAVLNERYGGALVVTGTGIRPYPRNGFELDVD